MHLPCILVLWEREVFSCALKVMAYVYASLTGTAVLQLKDIPECPEEYDGCIVLYGSGMWLRVRDGSAGTAREHDGQDEEEPPARLPHAVGNRAPAEDGRTAQIERLARAGLGGAAQWPLE